MNIRDVYGVDSAQQLYELASSHKLHVASMDALVRFAIAVQRLGFDEMARRELALDRMTANAEELGLYAEDVSGKD